MTEKQDTQLKRIKQLDKVNRPEDLQNLSLEELVQLAGEIREFITQSVSQTGGHLASNLGVVELTIAMHRVFDFRRDRLLWDVGHQCYAHKILTGRKAYFSRLRQEGGVSGFPSPEESPTDVFAVGHAGTSIATAIGMALGAGHNRTEEKIVALVGDASIVNGLSFEALNNMGLVKRQLLIVLNDNSMAIDVTQGSMASLLSKVRLSHTYEDVRNTTAMILNHLPVIGKPMEEALTNLKKTIRMAISPSRLFESLNIHYFGPVDGHDIGSLIQLFNALSELDSPAILHVFTRKGKGFLPADSNPRKFHSTGPFEMNGNHVSSAAGGRSYTEAFGDTLLEAARKDPKVIAITAAMSDGTGLAKFREEFPQRYYDVGIAESAAVDIAAGLAKQGLRPVVCIYSTFLQRSFDQIFQEVSLQNLPVVFCIDRAGVVGDDGPTHHGLWDIGTLRMLPNLILVSPADESEMRGALRYALSQDQPVAIRYPRDKIPADTEGLGSEPFETGRAIWIRKTHSEIVIVALGAVLSEAVKAAEQLEEDGILVSVINARFARPIDPAITDLFAQGKTVITAEDHSRAGGFGEALLALACRTAQEQGNEEMKQAIGKAVLLAAGEDAFIPMAKRQRQLEWMGLSAQRIAETVKKLIPDRSMTDLQRKEIIRQGKRL
jgi:1-deoxy-D-xylulose-5-phosphate synthase